MTGIADYIDWRGDIPFSAVAFNEVDNLILSQLAYVDFTEVVPENEDITLRHAAKLLYKLYPAGVKPYGLMQAKPLNTLLSKAAASVRFGNLLVSMPESRLDEESQEQFAAVTFLAPDCAYVTFRGTDHTIAGWQENFNMVVEPTIPAQKDAVTYLERAAAHTDCAIVTIGHSKGGNLAIYSAAFSNVPQERISCIYNNDGPGFPPEISESAEMSRVLSKIISIVPQNSVVGILFEHRSEYSVVRSNHKGLMQHDGLSWAVQGGHFSILKERSAQSVIIDRTLTDWLSAMTAEQMRNFVAALYEILSASGAKTLDELPHDTMRLIKKLKGLDEQTREQLGKAVRALREQAIASAKQTINEQATLKVNRAKQTISDQAVNPVKEKVNRAKDKVGTINIQASQKVNLAKQTIGDPVKRGMNFAKRTIKTKITAKDDEPDEGGE